MPPSYEDLDAALAARANKEAQAAAAAQERQTKQAQFMDEWRRAVATVLRPTLEEVAGNINERGRFRCSIEASSPTRDEGVTLAVEPIDPASPARSTTSRLTWRPDVVGSRVVTHEVLHFGNGSHSGPVGHPLTLDRLTADVVRNAALAFVIAMVNGR